MRRPRRPLFLAPDPYRRRRLRDGARLLPVAGAFLMILPMLWTSPQQGTRALSGDVIWFFSIWAVLILAAALIARPLSQSDAEATGAMQNGAALQNGGAADLQGETGAEPAQSQEANTGSSLAQSAGRAEREEGAADVV